MVGRFIGSALLQKVTREDCWAFARLCAACLVAISMLTTGHVAMYSIILVWIIQFDHVPEDLHVGNGRTRPLNGDGSGLLVMAIVGGAIIPEAQGSDCRDRMRHSSRVLPPGDLLPVHPVLCVERIAAEQPAIRQGVDRVRHRTRVRKSMTITDTTRAFGEDTLSRVRKSLTKSF